MKEYPILFKGEMVRAILAGQKSQTRRLRGLARINHDPDAWRFVGMNERACDGILYAVFCHIATAEAVAVRAPYGRAGDRLWVRETFMWGKGADCRESYIGTDMELMLGDPPHYIYRATDPQAEEYGEFFKWRPSIHMPRRASRLTPPVTDVRIQRLQEITWEDALREGVSVRQCTHDYIEPGYGCPDCMNTGILEDPVPSFERLWDSINGETDPWESNPFVWVYNFDSQQAGTGIRRQAGEGA